MSTEIETEMTERAALSECPFCGDVAHILSFPEAPGEYVAECVGCGVGSPIIVALMDDPIPAIEQAWNKRAYRMNGAARDVLEERKRQIDRQLAGNQERDGMTDTPTDRANVEALDARLASQIGDDISVIFNHESLFKQARAMIAALALARDAALRREDDANRSAFAHRARAYAAEARISELERDLKTVLDREAETHRRHDAKMDAAEARNEDQTARIKKLEADNAELASLVAPSLRKLQEAEAEIASLRTAQAAAGVLFDMWCDEDDDETLRPGFVAACSHFAGAYGVSDGQRVEGACIAFLRAIKGEAE